MASVKIIGRVAVKVYPDTRDFKNDLKKDLRRIEKQIGKMQVEVVPNVNKAAEQKVKAQMERLRKNLSGKNVSLQPAIATSHAAKVNAVLSVLARDRRVAIKPHLDAAAIAGVASSLMALGGARVALDSLGEGIERLMELDRLVPTIGATAVKVTLLGAAAAAATGHVLSLSASLASISGATLALPGLFGGVTVGLGTTIAALKDFNDVIPELSNRLSALQNQLSARFWVEAEAPIRSMIDNLWPAFAQGIRQTSTALGTFFGNLAASFEGFDLKPMFDNLIASVEIFSKHTDSITGIIEKLGLVGSEYLPRLATWFGDILDRFNAWLGAAASDGRLQGWIETGITNLTALGNVIRYTSSIFSGLADAAAAAGGATLVSLAAGLKNIASVVNSPGFQSGLTDTFRAAYAAMDNLSNAAGPGVKAMLLSLRDLFIEIGPRVGASFGALVGSIGAALSDPAVANGIRAMFEGIGTAMDNLSGAAGPIASILASLGPIVGALAANISALLTTGLDRMAPTFTGIATAVVPLINMLGGMFQDVLNSLTPLWQTLGQNIARVIEALTPLIGAFRDLWNLLAPVVVPVLRLIASIIGDTVVMAINGVTNVVQGFVGFIKGVVNLVKALIKGDWKGAWEACKQIIKSVFEAILGVIQVVFAVGVLGLLRKGWTAIKSLFTSSGASLKTIASELWSSIKSRTGELWAQIQVMPQAAMSAIVRFIKGIAGDMRAAASLAWEAIVKACTTTLTELWAIFRGLPGKIKGFLAGAGTLLFSIGSDIIQGLVNGIASMFGAVQGKLGDLTQKIKDWKGPAPVDRVLLTPAGQMIIDGLIKGLESRYKDVKSSLNGLTSDIAKSFDGSQYRVGVATHFDTTRPDLSAIDGLTRTVAVNATGAASQSESGNVQIDNITIPLEDLAQLKSLEEFLDMLRVRTRQGVLA